MYGEGEEIDAIHAYVVSKYSQYGPSTDSGV